MDRSTGVSRRILASMHASSVAFKQMDDHIGLVERRDDIPSVEQPRILTVEAPCSDKTSRPSLVLSISSSNKVRHLCAPSPLYPRTVQGRPSFRAYQLSAWEASTSRCQHLYSRTSVPGQHPALWLHCSCAHLCQSAASSSQSLFLVLHCPCFVGLFSCLAFRLHREQACRLSTPSTLRGCLAHLCEEFC